MNWWEKSWNPVVGCTPVSPGCDNCYAKALHDQRHKALLAGKDVPDCYARPFEAVRCLDERLMMPLRWREPQRVFVNSVSDLFHLDVQKEFLLDVFAVMALASQHTFYVLTKRPERMRDFIRDVLAPASMTSAFAERMIRFLRKHPKSPGGEDDGWPLPNVWLGVTAENQEQADARIPILLDTPAAKRFVSIEPMLGPVSVGEWISGDGFCPGCGEIAQVTEKCADCGRLLNDQVEPLRCPSCQSDDTDNCCAICGESWAYTGGPYLDWVICGGESGPGARPMHPDWARTLRDQCHAAGVPFFFKQWGEWESSGDARYPRIVLYADGRSCEFAKEAILAEETRSGICHGKSSRPFLMSRVGSSRAGRLLDGREHNEIPSGGAS